MFRLGAARELRSKLAKVRDGNDRARLFENQDMRDRIAAIFPEKAQLTRFMRAVEEESMMNRTRNEATKGSPTAKNLAEDSRSMGDAASTAIDVATGNPLLSTLRFGANLLKKAPAMTRQEAEAVARIGTNPDLGATLPQVANAPQPREPGALARAGVGLAMPPAAQVRGLGTVAASPAAPAAGAYKARQLQDRPTDGPRPQNLPSGGGGLRILNRPGPAPTGAAPAAPALDIQTQGNVNLEGVQPSLRQDFVNLQRQWGSRIPVTSGYRSEAHNRAVGGAEKSQHLSGNALDLDVSGMSLPERRELIRLASEMGFTGIGVYDNSIHLDKGERRVWGPSHHGDSIPRWAQQATGQHMGRK